MMRTRRCAIGSMRIMSLAQIWAGALACTAFTCSKKVVSATGRTLTFPRPRRALRRAGEGPRHARGLLGRLRRVPILLGFGARGEERLCRQEVHRRGLEFRLR